jgi:hypothetical protein
MFSNAEICDFDKKMEPKLEQRLVEYLKKKKYYKENRIESNLVEREYNIDKKDLDKIRNYFNGRKVKHTSAHTDMVEPKVAQFESERLGLGSDKRLDKMHMKQQKHKDAFEKKNNYDIMHQSYDMYRNDQNFSSMYGDDFKSRFNPQVWLDSDEIKHNNIVEGRNSFDDKDSEAMEFENSNPNDARIVDMRKRYSNPNIYKNEPAKIRYRDYMTRGCNEDLTSKNYSLDSIMDNMNKYNGDLSRYESHDAMDSDMKVNISEKRQNNSKRDNMNNYMATPHMNGSKQKDVDMENYLCYGQGPSRGAKSLGYPNPAEHYFSYISDDISKSEHTVFEPGMPSRMFNKETARNNYKGREVLPNFAFA